MKFKRKIALLLTIILLFSNVPLEAFSVPTTDKEFIQYLDDNGLPTESTKGKPPILYVYQRYGLVAYGTFNPTDDMKWSPETGKDEPRYLGYKADDTFYYNSKYPNDDRGSRTPLQWTYIPVDGASLSWNKGYDTDQLNYMLSTNLTFEAKTYSGLNVNWIKQANAKLQSPASFKNGFSVYTQHYGDNGKLYYATLYGPEMGGGTNVSGNITTPADTYTIKAGQTSVTIPVTVTATANLKGTYVTPNQIKLLQASFLNQKTPEVGGITDATLKYNYNIQKDQFPTPGTYSVRLTGFAKMESTLSGSDHYMAEVFKDITVIVEGSPNAYVDVTATANPARKQIDGSSDEKVTVAVNATLKGYTDTANIAGWTVYAKLDEEELTLQRKDNPGGALSTSASFSFTVPKSKFNFDQDVKSYLQKFKVTAIATLVNPIKDVANQTITNYQGSTYTSSLFYVESVNEPPVAVLYAEDTVRAGDLVSLDASSSYDPDGYITSYVFNSGGGNIEYGDESYQTVWYPYTGMAQKTYNAAVRVWDNGGASDADSKKIIVTAPTVEAGIKVDGKLKVNRLVTISDASSSPEHYPVDTSKTVWTLQAVSGGTNTDIKYSGGLTGVDGIKVIFKKPGTYKATLKVTNAAGFTAMTERNIVIGPDLAPKADYSTATLVLRDIKDNGKASINLMDTSYSLDGDPINSRVWSYAFDSDNDGSFADETYTVFDSGNNKNPILKVSTVGKYHIKEIVQENFTDTLPIFILPTDYLSDDTTDKIAAESIVEVGNIAPSVAFSMIDKKKVDLYFNVWDTKHNIADIQTKINSTIVPALAAENIDAEITVSDNYDVTSTSSKTPYYGYRGTIGRPGSTFSSEFLGPFLDLSTPTGIMNYVSNRTEDVLAFLGDTGTFGTYKISGDKFQLGQYNTYGYNFSLVFASKAGHTEYNADDDPINFTPTKSKTLFQMKLSYNNWDTREGIACWLKTPDGMSYHLSPAGGNNVWIKSMSLKNGILTIVASGAVGNRLVFIDKTFKVDVSSLGSNFYNNSQLMYFRYNNGIYYYRSNGEISLPPGVKTIIYDYSKYLDKLLSEHTFRANSKPYVITIADKDLEELAEPLRQATALNYALEKNVNFVGLGTTNNQTQFTNFILGNNNLGSFIDNSNLDTAMDGLKAYILGIENKEEPKTQYAIWGEDLEYLNFYDDFESDIKNSEQWQFTHTNPNLFDNSLGKDPQSGQMLLSPIKKFNYVGAYDALLKVQDNPYDNSLFDNYKKWSEDVPMQLIVHRRPVASFTPYIAYDAATSKYVINSVDNSYDLDHNISRTDKGIVQKQWKWKFVEDAAWQTGFPADIVYGKTYQLMLMVKDIEGAWSLPAVEIVSVPDILINANPMNRQWNNTDCPVVLSTIVNKGTFSKMNYKWTNDKIKPSIGWTSAAIKSVNLNQTLNGEWYLHAEVLTTEGQSKYAYFGPYQIDKIPPTIVADKNSVAESNEPVTVNVSVTDAGGSGIKDVKYLWSKAWTKPSTGWTPVGSDFSATQDEEGVWYLHIEATDNAGNVTYGRLGTYTVNTYKLEKFRVVMVRDVQLEQFYRNPSRALGNKFYSDKPMYANDLAVDAANFGIEGLTKGYRFDFEIDSTNFNEDLDTIVIIPHFYTGDPFTRDNAERALYWEDSNHQIFKAGEGGHSAWRTITLTKNDRTISNLTEATWRGQYLIPATAWAVPLGTSAAQAKSKDLKRDIIVNFEIKGYKAGVMKFDYNLMQWGLERSVPKYPYQIGDVIRYSWRKSLFDDKKVIDNR